MRIGLLHPFSLGYTTIYDCLQSGDEYVLFIDRAKREAFEKEKPANVTLVMVENYQENIEMVCGNWLEKEHLDALLALDEFDVEVAARLRENYGIPGQSSALAKVFRNKNVMTERVRELGFRVPTSTRVQSFQEAEEFLRTHGKIIVKPLAGAGSVDTFPLGVSEGVERLEGLDLPSLLLQEYIEGDIYHIDGLLACGQVIYCEPSRYLYNPLLIKEGISAAAVSLEQNHRDYATLRDYAIHLARSLDPKGTYLFHLEVFYTGEEIIFLEIACRMGGARIRQNLERKFGQDPFALLLTAVGKHNFPELPEHFPAVGWLLTAKKSGVLQRIPDLTPEKLEEFGIYDTIVYTKIGRKIQSAQHSADAVLGLSFVGKDFETVRRQLLAAEAWCLQETHYF